ncbi:hypothetical protein GQ42DRAFT_173433 [Ramicandelaber brevisporus]|nr:hypothetical protein GQ42DRAFT_173433 [Ramicandelaber brevisporus]
MKIVSAFTVFALVAVVAVHAAPAPSPLSVDVGASGSLSVGVQTPHVNATLNTGGNINAHADPSKIVDAAKQVGIDLAKSPISFDQFQKAVTDNGLPAPSVDAFLNFLKPFVGPTGSIIITAAQVSVKLASAIVKGVFGLLGQIKPNDVLDTVNKVIGN